MIASFTVDNAAKSGAPGSGGFLTSCHTHCEAQQWGFDDFKIDGSSMRDAAAAWITANQASAGTSKAQWSIDTACASPAAAALRACTPLACPRGKVARRLSRAGAANAPRTPLSRSPPCLPPTRPARHDQAAVRREPHVRREHGPDDGAVKKCFAAQLFHSCAHAHRDVAGLQGWGAGFIVAFFLFFVAHTNGLRYCPPARVSATLSASRRRHCECAR